MMPWYLEIRSPMGHWSPQLWADRPSVQTIHGTDYLRSTGGHSPRVRAVQEVPGHLSGAGLKAVQAALSPDRVEVARASAVEGAVECGEGHKCPSGPHGACCGHPTAQIADECARHNGTMSASEFNEHYRQGLDTLRQRVAAILRPIATQPQTDALAARDAKMRAEGMRMAAEIAASEWKALGGAADAIAGAILAAAEKEARHG